MNVAALNQNNNTVDSVVLPPRMKDIYGWWDLHSGRYSSATKVTGLYDRSGRGNYVRNVDANTQPDIDSSLSTQFNHGRNIGLFNEGDYLSSITVDFDDVFGSTPSRDPEFEVAVVLAEGSGSAGFEAFFSLNSSTESDQIYLARHNQGVAFRVRGSGDNTFDTADVLFTQDTAQTFIFSLQQDGSGAMDVYGWVGGSLLDWDDVGIGTNYPCDPDTFRGMDELCIGGVGTSAGEYIGRIAEMIFWKGKSTAAERIELLNYLQDKWGCT